MTETPDALRRRVRAIRRGIDVAGRMAAADAVATQLLSLPFAPTRGFVAGYWAVDGEVPLHAWQMGLPVDTVYCLPVLHEDGRLRFAPWRPGEPLRANRHGIPEPETVAAELLRPESMDFVVVPLVAFDAACNRIGMGAGWYDRSFAHRRERMAPPWLVGAAYAAQQVESLDAQPWDVTLDGVCSDGGMFLRGECKS